MSGFGGPGGLGGGMDFNSVRESLPPSFSLEFDIYSNGR